MKVIRQGFDSWLNDLSTVRPDARQLDQAKKHKAATAEALRMLEKIAKQLANCSDADIKNIEKHLSAMNIQVGKLTSMFPRARLQQNVETSQAPNWARFPSPHGEVLNEPSLSSSERQNSYHFQQNTRTSSFESRGPPRRNTASNNFDPRAAPRRRIESIDAYGNANFVGGERIQTSEDAEGAARLGGIDVGPVRIGGTASAILGNVYGRRNPTDTRTSLPRHWSES